MYKILDVRQVRMVANIVKDCSQLNHLSQKGNAAIGAKILVTDNGFTDCICLVLCRTKVFQHIERFETTIELERHASCELILFGGANVMKKTGYCERGGRKGIDILGELLSYNGGC